MSANDQMDQDLHVANVIFDPNWDEEYKTDLFEESMNAPLVQVTYSRSCDSGIKRRKIVQLFRLGPSPVMFRSGRIYRS
jgi:hypothetical protein